MKAENRTLAVAIYARARIPESIVNMYTIVHRTGRRKSSFTVLLLHTWKMYEYIYPYIPTIISSIYTHARNL